MSLLSIPLRGLSAGPNHWMASGQLVARSGWVTRALSLFATSRTVRVDKANAFVFVEDTTWWVRKSVRAIPFRDLDHIIYERKVMLTSATMIEGRATDSLEAYSVWFELKDRSRVHLFDFYGEGAVGSGLGGVLLGDDIIDLHGTQQEESLDYVTRLRLHTGLKIGADVPDFVDEQGRAWACGDCGRAGPPRAIPCLYCGGALKPGAS